MFVNSVIGHEKAPFQTFLDSDESLKEVVSALGVEDSTIHLTLEVREVAAELATSKVMAKYGISVTGTAKAHLCRLYQARQQLGVSIVQ